MLRHLPYVLLLVSGGMLARPYLMNRAIPLADPIVAATPVSMPQATPPWGISELNRGAYNHTGYVSGGPTYVDSVYVSSPVYVNSRSAPYYRFPSPPMYTHSETPYTPSHPEHVHHAPVAAENTKPPAPAPAPVTRPTYTHQNYVHSPTTTRPMTTSYEASR